MYMTIRAYVCYLCNIVCYKICNVLCVYVLMYDYVDVCMCGGLRF